MGIFSNSTLFAYDNDIFIIGNTGQEVVTRVTDQIKATKLIDLEVNQGKKNFYR